MWEVRKSDIAVSQLGQQVKEFKGRSMPCASSPNFCAETHDGRTGYTGQRQGEADSAIQPMSLRAMVCHKFWKVGRMELVLK